jgi:hypothetical protein
MERDKADQEEGTYCKQLACLPSNGVTYSRSTIAERPRP